MFEPSSAGTVLALVPGTATSILVLVLNLVPGLLLRVGRFSATLVSSPTFVQPQLIRDAAVQLA